MELSDWFLHVLWVIMVIDFLSNRMHRFAQLCRKHLVESAQVVYVCRLTLVKIFSRLQLKIFSPV
jgi:hypothetical protein